MAAEVLIDGIVEVISRDSSFTTVYIFDLYPVC